MTDRTSLGEPRTAFERSLERSLREGPPDEGGYRAESLALSTDAHVESGIGLPAGRSIVPIGRQAPRAIRVFASLDSLAVLVAAVVIGFVLVQGAMPGGPGGPPRRSEQPSASPVPVPSLTETFVSTRNGFSVRYPEGWSTRAATTSWRPNTMLPIGNPAQDELKLDGVARLVVASQRLEAGQTESSWIASYGEEYFLRRCSGDRAAWPRVVVDGRSGYLVLNGCALPADHEFSTPDLTFDVLVFAADRVYRIALDGVVDRGYFEAILATVRLDPSSAIDPPEGP